MLKVQNVAENSSSSSKKGKEVFSSMPKPSNPWPIRIKLTTDNLLWDSLKVSPSKEFEDCILEHMNEESRKALDSWIPTNIEIYDVDTCETYKVKLVKKESFWFEPMPLKATMVEQPCYDLEEARETFAYSVEPFRHIARKRKLNYDQEIGFRFSSCKAVNRFEFSVLYSPIMDIHFIKV
ncbi:hypothetical protein O6P43_007533 [Quillaja saponaria]|uniref:Uncharacterized protein n=1 Tax=Quillaja saponaria TaxID=32244 RepID=A0AAD7VJM7_QUISA|nr:hypothetical protein O6P43_007533 [Quillaja saponaria]